MWGLFVLAASSAGASDNTTDTIENRLPGLATSSLVRYDIELLTTSLNIDFGRNRLQFTIGNALELPEHMPPGGAWLDETTVLADAFSGIEVDTGEERMFSLEFSVRW